MVDRSPLELRWLGHATVAVTLDGIRFMTDPALTPRLAHLRRRHPVDAAMVRADVVLISHVHMDHLHVPSLRLLGPDVAVIAPHGAAAFLSRRGFRGAREVRAGDRLDIGTVAIEVVPAVHPPRRGPHSRLSAPAVGYVLRGSEGAVYFPGDTDLFPGMADLGPVDVALLPIAGWGPTLGEGHLNPDRATEATDLLLPRFVVPIHWGTYSRVRLRSGPPAWLHTPAEEFRAQMTGRGHGDRLRLLEPGELLVTPEARTATERDSPGG
jgi:L-ascorbate metabolism protein UlaG (beta-lactamase superfamily)